jgi:ethanolamine utilization protein EutA
MPSSIDNLKVTSNQHLQSTKLRNEVYLLGLDFGSTTSSALLASAHISRSVTGRMSFSEISILFRSEPVFTPFVNGQIDLVMVSKLINDWLTQSGVSVQQLFSGGCIITGLAAKANNSLRLQSLIKNIVGESVIATADDPSLESWLAFMGCSASLSRYYSNNTILNLDIGGGTTNTALGSNGDVFATGCYFVGARHFKFVEGSYKIVEISNYGKALLEDLKITKQIGDCLNENECSKIIKFYIDALEAIALNQTEFFQSKVGQLHQQVPLKSDGIKSIIITYSGGVGELIYQLSSGLELPSTTHFGDFGIDLAKAIVQSPTLSTDLKTIVPENKGRATLYGLTLHNTEISGHTLFLPHPDLLPLSNLPIIAKLSLNMPSDQWQSAFELACRHKQGACIQIINFSLPKLEDIKQLAKKIQSHFKNFIYLKNQPLVILVEANIGKALGQYCTNWGEIMSQLIVIDEVPLRHAQFVQLGRLHQHMLPVSFYGMQ